MKPPTLINGWQRIGIVLSLLWIIFVCGYTAYELIKKVDASTYLIEVTHNKPTFDSQGHRTMTIEEAYGEDARRSLKVTNFLSAILIPMTFAWGIVYLCIFTFRWIIIGFKVGKPLTEPFLSAAPLPVDSPSQQTRPLIPEHPPQKRKSTMKMAWNGEVRLWKVFWIYIVLNFFLISLLRKVLEEVEKYVSLDNSILWRAFVAIFGLLVTVYFIWVSVSLWKCAFNSEWKVWGYVCRVIVVCRGVSFMGIILAIVLKQA
jgi:hypothetical protein